MKLDPGMHIGLHLVFFGKSGVTSLPIAPPEMLGGSPAGVQGRYGGSEESFYVSSSVHLTPATVEAPPSGESASDLGLGLLDVR
jgi:hypothetical protein